MDDKQIVDLFFERNEDAISETEKKYSRYVNYIAANILPLKEDCEECANDVYMRLWNSIPPAKPDNLKAYVGTLTRNLALDMHDKNTAKKRKSATELVYDEIAECIPDTGVADTTESLAIKDALNKFLGSLNQGKRIVFMQRYWYLSSVKEIAEKNGLTENNVKITLLRLRAKLKKFLEKEGLNV